MLCAVLPGLPQACEGFQGQGRVSHWGVLSNNARTSGSAGSKADALPEIVILF